MDVCRWATPGWCNQTEGFAYSGCNRHRQRRDGKSARRPGEWRHSDGRWEEQHLQSAGQQRWRREVWRGEQRRGRVLPHTGSFSFVCLLACSLFLSLKLRSDWHQVVVKTVMVPSAENHVIISKILPLQNPPLLLRVDRGAIFTPNVFCEADGLNSELFTVWPESMLRLLGASGLLFTFLWP